MPPTFFREAGAGPGVLCLHANASSSSQWRGLMELLAPNFHVLAPDGHGAGKGPPWPAAGGLRLHDEAALLQPLLARAATPTALVGHSYGGAVALVAALQQPARFTRLVLYEPTLFSLLDAETPAPNQADGIRDAVRRTALEWDAGRPQAAAACFIDYWMGPGSFEAMPEARREPIVAATANVRGWAEALMAPAAPAAAFQALQMPVLLLVGRNSTPAAHGVARLLAALLPNVQRVDLEGLGHMGPVTHPEQVNPLIEAFLRA